MADGLATFASYGQETTNTTRHLAIMNLAICGDVADFGWVSAKSIASQVSTISTIQA